MSGLGMKIYHIISQENWQKAQDRDEYSPSSLDSEGFIHASKKEQVLPTANRRYRDKEDLLLLVINSKKVKPKIIYEYSSGAGEEHPHIYGSLNLGAIEKVLSLKKDDSGEFYL